MEDLKTWEGLFAMAEQYAAWTDNQTPDIPDDGKNFFVHDYHFNYFQVGVESLGENFFKGENLAFGPDSRRPLGRRRRLQCLHPARASLRHRPYHLYLLRCPLPERRHRFRLAATYRIGSPPLGRQPRIPYELPASCFLRTERARAHESRRIPPGRRSRRPRPLPTAHLVAQERFQEARHRVCPTTTFTPRKGLH